MLLSASRSGAVALTSAALMGLSALAIPTVAGAAETDCAPANATYSVTGGTIEWGVKQSFRSYLQGPIAAGGWTLGEGVTFAGAERGADGRFIWPIAADTGEVRADDSATASGTGSITLSGHDDVLNTTLSNPTVDITGTSGSLKLDYRAKLPEGFTPDTDFEWVEGTQATAVEFTLDSAPIFNQDGTITVTTGPTEMSESFGPAVADFYDAGVPMDPANLNLTVSSTCDAGPGDGEPGDGDNDGDNNGGGIFGSVGNIFGSLGF